MHVQIVEFQHVLGGAEICQMFHVEEVGFWVVLGTSFSVCFSASSGLSLTMSGTATDCWVQFCLTSYMIYSSIIFTLIMYVVVNGQSLTVQK